MLSLGPERIWRGEGVKRYDFLSQVKKLKYLLLENFRENNIFESNIHVTNMCIIIIAIIIKILILIIMRIITIIIILIKYEYW